jgi:hypothetical protein
MHIRMLSRWQSAATQRRVYYRSLFVYVLCVVAWLAGATPSVASAPMTPVAHDYRFGVYYNDKRIGEHEFSVIRNAEEIRVTSRAEFVFKLLFVPVYKYEHVAEERWQAGCLRQLDATTNDNGERFTITTEQVRDQLVLARLAPTAARIPVDDPCPASYAYWDLDLLTRTELINAQTGEIMPATLTDHGVEQFDGVPARRITLDANEAGVIHLWYRQSDNRWIGLETTRDGGILSYRLKTHRSHAPARA